MWLPQTKSLSQLQAFWRCSKSHYFLLCRFYSDTPDRKKKAAPLQEARMRDRFTICAKGGDGGNGSTSIRRSRHERRGKPDGGNGGRGGDVILECSPSVWDFRGLQHHIHAGRGGHGTSKNKIGTRGEDKVVSVPIGTVIHILEGEISSVVETQAHADLDPWELPGKLDNDQTHPQSEEQSGLHTSNIQRMHSADNLLACGRSLVGVSEVIKQGAETDLEEEEQEQEEEQIQYNVASEVIKQGAETDLEEEEEEQIQYNVAELTEQGQRLVIAHGGDGGLGNVCYPNVMTKPKHLKQGNHKYDGNDGEESNDDQASLRIGPPGCEVSLVLELKSIADVGLVGMPNAGKSTLLGAISRARPAVGHYAFTTLRPNLGNLNFEGLSIKVADIPGLIKGAHKDRGLGHAFLRHIERTKVLAYVVDLAAALDGKNGIPPWEQLKDLILELEHHQQGLSDRPSLVVANKIDETGAEEVYRELEKRVQGVPIYPVCAVLGEGVAEVKDGLKILMNDEQNFSRLSINNNIDVD